MRVAAPKSVAKARFSLGLARRRRIVAHLCMPPGRKGYGFRV